MAAATFHVEADWDSDACVWVATSQDVPGLATEAEAIEELAARLRIIIPELLEANGQIPSGSVREPISFELTSRRHELVTPG